MSEATAISAPNGRGRRADPRVLPIARRATARAYAVAIAITIVPWVLQATHPVLSTAILPALAGLAALAWWSPRRPEPSTADVVLEGGCVLVAVGVVGPVAALPLLYTSVIRRSLASPTIHVAVAAGLFAIAVAGGTAIGGHPLGGAGLAATIVALTVTAVAVRAAAAALVRSEQSAAARFEAVVRGSSDLLLITTADTTVTYVSPSVADILRFAPEDVLGRPLLELVDDGDRALLQHSVTGTGRRSHTLECQMRRGDGSIVHAEIAVNDMLADPVVGGLVLSIRNITDRATAAHQLRHQAFHDPLTKLANRALFLDRLQLGLDTARPQAAIILLDLDGFKGVNDTLGHEAGDALLAEVADRLRSSVAPADTVARLGGDEFAILLVGGRGNEHTALDVAQRIGTAFTESVVIMGQRVVAQGSIGIAVASAGSTTSGLLRNADVAMYRAKAAGKNRVEVFHSEMDRDAARKVEAETELRHAAAAGSWVAHYQPIVDLVSGQIHAVEALVRWNHPERGLLAPGDFLPLAEETGVILDIGIWMLTEACTRVAGWQREAPLGAGLGLHLNVSDRQVRDAGFVASVRTALETSGLARGTLTLEITEHVLSADTDDVVRARLLDLKRLGVRVAVDDFGTGVCSLGALPTYPIDALKIDRSFVSRITWPDGESSGLARTVLAMGAALGLIVIAEGIETAEEHAELVSLGCLAGQGFSIARPLTLSAISELLLGTAAPLTSALV